VPRVTGLLPKFGSVFHRTPTGQRSLEAVLPKLELPPVFTGVTACAYVRACTPEISKSRAASRQSSVEQLATQGEGHPRTPCPEKNRANRPQWNT
jgi:hypothetical protein